MSIYEKLSALSIAIPQLTPPVAALRALTSVAT
jgi:hypothetical protein